MSIIKSFAVGYGDMFYIDHNSDNFTIIDCDLNSQNADGIIDELRKVHAKNGISRFICTHPDDDHFGGIHLLDDALPIANFYVVENQAIKENESESFTRYCELRDGDRHFYIYKNCSRKWMNQTDDVRHSSGIHVLWPQLDNAFFKEALKACNAGESYNNTSAVIRYKLDGGASALWLGDLETSFMESIEDSIELTKTTIVFAAHHGRQSGKIPNSWLEKLDPQIIVIGEAPSRHLHYYSGYRVITQNLAGDITFDLDDDKVHLYVASDTYEVSPRLEEILVDEARNDFPNYLGTFTVETAYTLENI